MEKQRVIVYIDGFNFYYGLKRNAKWKRYYWLDFVRLFESMMKPHQELISVKHFSAMPLNDVEKAERQRRLFEANKNNPKYRLILGRYLQKKFKCRNCGFEIVTYEEKESDVRIATQIVSDADAGNCDAVVIVSADSDMKPAAELAKAAGLQVFFFFPPNHHSNALLDVGDSVVKMGQYERAFKQSVLPDEVILTKSGYTLHIPEKWKAYQPKEQPM